MNEDFAKFLLVAMGAGIVIWIISEDEPKKRGQRNAVLKGGRRTLTLDRMVSREPSDPETSNKMVVKESLPNLEATASTMSSRRSIRDSVGSSTTSKKTLISKTPFNDFSIRKYPYDYYQLSKKQQWKFRQKLNQ